MPLKGIKVIEFVGLAPGPFCGMLLKDFGATVTRIDRTPNNSLDVLQNGKRSLALDLKKPNAIKLIKSLCKTSDVLVEPFRPGIMEKLGLGPETLLKDNPRLIYARLTGFGQTGPYAARAGHDINYLAISGILSLFGRKGEKPTPPVNFGADFAGGGLLCAFGILAALLERHNSGKGQIVDHSMSEGAAYVGSWLIRSQKLTAIWPGNRGENALDTGTHFYDTYETKDQKFMSVGPVETKFYEVLLEKLNIKDLPQYENFDESKKVLAKAFKTKTQKEWTQIFENVDACVFPVLEWREAPDFHQNKIREVYQDREKVEGEIVPSPAPKMSRTPARSGALESFRDEYDMAKEILAELGYDENELKNFYIDGTLLLSSNSKL